MGSCTNKLNCGSLYKSRTIEVIPDIVGIGILVAFLATSLSAVLLIIYAYFKPCLPSDVMTWVDLGLLQNWHLCKKCRERFSAIVKSRTPDPHTFCKHTNPYRDTRRRKALSAFLLTLGDQQLVVGPAVIIGALAQRCRLSCYEFQMVRNLAMLASVAHLSTLIALGQYLISNKVVRGIRVVGMLVNLGLLIFTFVVGEAAELVDSSAKVQCLMDDLSILVADPSAFSITLIWTLYLVAQYSMGIGDLYDFEYNQVVLQWLCFDSAKKHALSEPEFEEWYSRKITESIYHPESNARRELYWLQTVSSDRKFPQLDIINVVVQDYVQSISANIEGNLLSISYGVAKIIDTKMTPPRIKNNTNAIDFGQVVPLYLAQAIVAQGAVTRLHMSNTVVPGTLPRLLKLERQRNIVQTLPRAHEPTDISRPTIQQDRISSICNSSLQPIHDSSSTKLCVSNENAIFSDGHNEASTSSNDPHQPPTESENSAEEVDLLAGATFDQRGRNLLVFYSLARTKTYLNILFILGVIISLTAGIGSKFDILFMVPWFCWYAFTNGVRIFVYIRYLRQSWVMSKELLALLKEIPEQDEFKRAKVLEKAITGTDMAEDAGEVSANITQEPEAIGKAFDTRESLEMDELAQEPWTREENDFFQ